jgi:putative glutamine amidotransferase
MKKPLFRLIAVIIIITGLAFWTCQTAKDKTIYIAVSKYKDTANYLFYKAWLQGVDSNIVLVDLYHIPLDSALRMLEKCSGLLMSGGADVHPGYYGQPEDTVLCEIDFYRDTLEMAILEKANRLNMPVFGVCRGLQVLNVFYGGSLYPDIPERFDTSVVHRTSDRSFDAMHPVSPVEGSWLKALTGVSSGEVNSMHHQGIHRLALPLKASAYSPDSLIEAIERIETDMAPFLMAVQWHPERLGLDHPLSGPLANRFIQAAKEYQQKQKK